MRKFLHVPLFLIAMFFAVIPISAHDFEVDGIYYSIISSNKVYVTYRGTSYANETEYTGSIIIPETVTYSGTTYSVTNIGSHAFHGCTGLTSVTIPNSVTYIGSDAFYGCSRLTSVAIPQSVTEIEYNAFRDCIGLTSVTIPKSVTKIGHDAFRDCTGLTSVNFQYSSSATNIGNYAFYGCTGLISLTIPCGTSFGRYVFSNCTGLTSISFLNAYTYIGYGMFSGCTGLTSVNIPYPCEIGDYAFENCTNLTNIWVSSKVRAVGAYAFAGCINLAEIGISPNSTLNILTDAFHGTAWYNNQPDGLIYIDKVLYEYKGTMPTNTSIEISDGTICIGGCAFYGCAGLVSITIPESVTSISCCAFSGCTGLKELIIPNSETVVHNSAFFGCSNVEEVSLGCDADYYSSSNSFVASFTNLKRLNILSSAQSINFDHIAGIQEIELNIEYGPDPLLVIGYYGPDNCKIMRINRDLDRYNSSYEFAKFEVFSKIRKIIIGNKVGCINIPFNVCAKLAKIDIEDGDDGLSLAELKNSKIDTAYIGRTLSNASFAGVRSLKKVTVGDKAQMISGMFADCDSLQSLTLPFAGAGTAQTTSNFGELFGTTQNSNMRAVTQFMEDGTNKTYYLPTGLEELVLTEGCEMIPYGGLYNCNMLKTLTLPTTLYMVGDKALYGCAKMTDIYCKGADPAVAYDSSFDGMRLTTCKLHVPYNTSERYKMSAGWEKFYYVEEEAPLMVSVAKSIENAGVIYGINEYQPGQTAEMEAVAHSGYTFEGWYENGVLLTTESKYVFTVVDSHNLVASFLPVLDENEVSITPGAGNVALSWSNVDGASFYVAEIFEDADMKTSIGNIELGADGQIMSRSSMITATIADLASESDYYYRVTAFSSDNAVLSQFIGFFSTISGIYEVKVNNGMSYSILSGLLKIDGDGYVLVADVKGNIIYNGNIADGLTLNLTKGIYVLKINDSVDKIVVR